MARQLDTATLDVAAEYYASEFLANRGERDRDWVMKEFRKFAYKDAFDYLVEAIHDLLGAKAKADWDARAKKAFTPREDKTFAEWLERKLAITPDGEHIEGKIGTVKVDGRLLGSHVIEVEPIDSIWRRRRLGLDKSHREVVPKIAKLVWPVYAGEEEERQRPGGGAADPFPHVGDVVMMALNTRISNECALLGANALVDNLDEGSAGATIQGRTGAQPADPDTAVTGTNLFTMTASATAFGAATDGAPGGLKTANAITDDTSADATGTLGYVRASSSNAAATPLDDHIDGEAGTASADWIFNTLAIVAAATVSATSWTCTLPES